MAKEGHRVAAFAGWQPRSFLSDPGMGVIRHSDAGHDEAIDFVKADGIIVAIMKGVLLTLLLLRYEYI